MEEGKWNGFTWHRSMDHLLRYNAKSIQVHRPLVHTLCSCLPSWCTLKHKYHSLHVLMVCHFCNAYLHSSGRSNAAQRSHQSQPTLLPLQVMDQVLCLPQRTTVVVAGMTQWVKLEPAMQKSDSLSIQKGANTGSSRWPSSALK